MVDDVESRVSSTHHEHAFAKVLLRIPKSSGMQACSLKGLDAFDAQLPWLIIPSAGNDDVVRDDIVPPDLDFVLLSRCRMDVTSLPWLILNAILEVAHHVISLWERRRLRRVFKSGQMRNAAVRVQTELGVAGTPGTSHDLSAALQERVDPSLPQVIGSRQTRKARTNNDYLLYLHR